MVGAIIRGVTDLIHFGVAFRTQGKYNESKNIRIGRDNAKSRENERARSYEPSGGSVQATPMERYRERYEFLKMIACLGFALSCFVLINEGAKGNFAEFLKWFKWTVVGFDTIVYLAAALGNKNNENLAIKEACKESLCMAIGQIVVNLIPF